MLLKPRTAESTDHSEETLIRRACSGDKEAFAGLYEGHMDRIFRYFYYRTGHREESEDLTEQVFLKAWQAMPKYEYRGAPFAAWLYRIAGNLLADRRTPPQGLEQWDDSIEIEDGSASPFDLAAKQLEAEELSQAIRQLSDVEQSTLVLRFIQGLDHRTVAGIIGKSEVATRSIQSRALSRLAKILGPREQSEE